MSEGEILIPPPNSVERRIPKSAERVPQIEVRRTAWEIAHFYRTPETATARGLNTEVYFIPSSDIARIAFEEINRRTGRNLTVEQALRKRQEEIDKFNKDLKGGVPTFPNSRMITLEEIMSIGGICLDWTNGKSLIYLNQQAPGDKVRLKHELLHAMSMDSSGSSGFVDFDLAKGGPLNEAVVETLSISQRANKLSKGRLSDIQYIQGGNGDSETPYPSELSSLGFILECTEDTQPLTVFDISNIYFDHTKKPGEKRQLFKEILLQRISPEGSDFPMELLDKLIS